MTDVQVTNASGDELNLAALKNELGSNAEQLLQIAGKLGGVAGTPEEVQYLVRISEALAGAASKLFAGTAILEPAQTPSEQTLEEPVTASLNGDTAPVAAFPEVEEVSGSTVEPEADMHEVSSETGETEPLFTERIELIDPSGKTHIIEWNKHQVCIDGVLAPGNTQLPHVIGTFLKNPETAFSDIKSKDVIDRNTNIGSMVVLTGLAVRAAQDIILEDNDDTKIPLLVTNEQGNKLNPALKRVREDIENASSKEPEVSVSSEITTPVSEKEATEITTLTEASPGVRLEPAEPKVVPGEAEAESSLTELASHPEVVPRVADATPPINLEVAIESIRANMDNFNLSLTGRVALAEALKGEVVSRERIIEMGVDPLRVNVFFKKSSLSTFYQRVIEELSNLGISAEWQEDTEGSVTGYRLSIIGVE